MKDLINIFRVVVNMIYFQSSSQQWNFIMAINLTEMLTIN